jgi:hypothetical protein
MTKIYFDYLGDHISALHQKIFEQYPKMLIPCHWQEAAAQE